MSPDARGDALGSATAAAAPTVFNIVLRVVFKDTGGPPRGLTRRGEAAACQVLEFGDFVFGGSF